MITGLIQTTAVSIYAIYFVPRGELGYAVWLMLIHCTTQFPGFLGVFRGVLNSLEYFHKKAVLDFVRRKIPVDIRSVSHMLCDSRFFKGRDNALADRYIKPFCRSRFKMSQG